VTGAAKVNLIGHSHGSPTARYVASVRPDLVASVTSVGGVNKGSKVADIALGIAPGVPYVVADAVASLIGYLSGSPGLPQDARAANVSLSTQGAAAFNARHPEGVPVTACGEGAYQVRGVQYFSWSGSQPYTSVFDALDPLLALTALAFDEDNDGLVARCSSRLGRVIRDDYRMNHADQINQLFGLSSLAEVSPESLYRIHANRLQQLGL
ncbi:MAG TPA: triacylglycerol lipase, partial [Burkholderiaceae bacterium]